MTLNEKARRSIRARILTPVPGEKWSASAPLQFVEDGLIGLSADGNIVSVGPYLPGARGPILDLHPHVVVPGFSDAHVHFPQTRVIGSASGPLLEWLKQTVFPEEQRFSEEAYAAAVSDELFDRMFACGTTTAGIYASSSPVSMRVLFERAKKTKMFAQLGLVLMDRAAPNDLVVSCDVALSHLTELLSSFSGHETLRLAVTPRFALSCSWEFLLKAAQFASKNGLFVQTHLSENLAECEATLVAFPGAQDYFGVYESAGLAGPRSLFAHGIHLSEAEKARIVGTDSAIIHCPDSNFFLGSGQMGLRDLLNRGIRVGLGSDVAAGRTFDMRKVAASAYDTALLKGAPVSPKELFVLATWGGASVLGFGALTGALTPGRRADMAVIAVPEYAKSEADVLGHVLFASDSAPCVRTYMAGRSSTSEAARRPDKMAPSR